MNAVVVRIPAPLRTFTGGRDTVEAQGATLRDVVASLTRAYPDLRPHLLDDAGNVRRFVNIFVGDEDARQHGGLDMRVPEGALVSLLPAVAGGATGSGGRSSAGGGAPGGGRARDRQLAALRAEIPEVTPSEAFARTTQGGVLVDIREPDEVANGSPAGALRIVRGFLELRIEDAVPDPAAEVMLLCAGGVRSLFAADDLRRLGYRNVSSVAGGFGRWKRDGLPIEIPRVLNAASRERYGRHVLIPEVGEAGQMRLLESRVLLVGAGGLGSPAALYLAAAGVGTLGIIDDDVVDRSNLQRQILHTDARVGHPKVDSARATLAALNPDVRIETYPARLTRDNVEELFSRYEIIVDGADNFATRYLVNDACVKLGLPNVHGSIFRFEGQVSVFWPGRQPDPGPCYRCLYPEPPPPELAPSCAEAGVLGVLPGVVGTLEAVETIKLLLGIGEPLVGRLLVYDALRAEFRTLRVARDPKCSYCGDDVTTFPGYIDYAGFCGDRGGE